MIKIHTYIHTYVDKLCAGLASELEETSIRKTGGLMGFEHGCWTPFKVHGVGDTPECIREVTVCMMLCTNSARGQLLGRLGLWVQSAGDTGCWVLEWGNG